MCALRAIFWLLLLSCRTHKLCAIYYLPLLRRLDRLPVAIGQVYLLQMIPRSEIICKGPNQKSELISTNLWTILSILVSLFVIPRLYRRLNPFVFFQRKGLSKYNKIYQFKANVMGQDCEMVMTSVSGHLLALEFSGTYRTWQTCSPLSLFDAPVFKYCPENYQKIKVSFVFLK